MLYLKINKEWKVKMEGDPDDIRAAKDFLKVKNPLDYRPKGSSSKWDGLHRFYDSNNVFDFGLLLTLVKKLKKEDIEFQIIDERPFYEIPDEKIIFSKPFLKKEREYQREAIKALIKNRFGIIIVPTRGGKTFIVAESIRILWNLYKEKGKKEFKALFVVDTDDLFNQAVNDFSKVLDISPEKIGKIKSGEIDTKNVNVASIQTIERIIGSKKKKEGGIDFRKRHLQSFFETLDFLCVDEIQGYSNSNRLKHLPRNVYFRIGVSATPWDNTFEAYKLLSWFGTLLMRVKEVELKDNEVLVKNYVLLLKFDRVKCSKKGITGTPYQKEYQKKIVYNEYRNEVLCMLVKIFKLHGLKVLVLANRIAHGEIFYNIFGSKKRVFFISGNDSTEYRDEIKNRFLSMKTGGALIATDIYKKGVTLPQAQVIVNIGGQKKESLIIQKRGRVLAGGVDGKDFAFVVDCIDLLGGNIESHSEQRESVYCDLKKKGSVDEIYTFHSNDFDLVDQIKTKLNEFKRKGR